jgi:hypothetical protein
MSTSVLLSYIDRARGELVPGNRCALVNVRRASPKCYPLRMRAALNLYERSEGELVTENIIAVTDASNQSVAPLSVGILSGLDSILCSRRMLGQSPPIRRS